MCVFCVCVCVCVYTCMTNNSAGIISELIEGRLATPSSPTIRELEGLVLHLLVLSGRGFGFTFRDIPTSKLNKRGIPITSTCNHGDSKD